MLRRLIFVLAMAAAGNASAGAAPNAAHDLAQKFSGQTDAPQPTAQQNARATTASTKPPAPASTQSAAVKPFAKTETDKAKAQAAPSKVAASDRPPLDYEMDMLRRARAEEADRKSAAKPATNPTTTKLIVKPPVASPPATTSKSETAPTLATTTAAAPAKAAETVTPNAPAPTLPTPLPPPLAVTSPSVKAEPQKIVEAPAATATTAVTPAAPSAVAPAVIAPPTATRPTLQASVLLAIEIGGASSKGADANTLDPIICVADTCFLSAGLTADALKLSRSDALKLKSSNDASPDACRGKVGCVFRNVGLIKDALIEVVELGAAKPDPARTYAAEIDASCKAADGALACENPIATADFRIWIVPEATAKTAGAEAIEDAVADSLPHRDIARDTDK